MEMMPKKEKKEEEEWRGGAYLMVAHDSVGGSSSKQGGCIPRSRFADGSSFSLCFSFVLFIFFLLSISLSSFHFCSSLFVPFFFFFSSSFSFLCSPLFFFLFFFVFVFHSFLSSFFVLLFCFMFFTSSPPPFFSLFLLPVLPCIYIGQEKRATLPYLITSNGYGGWAANGLLPVGLVPSVFSS